MNVRTMFTTAIFASHSVYSMPGITSRAPIELPTRIAHGDTDNHVADDLGRVAEPAKLRASVVLGRVWRRLLKLTLHGAHRIGW